MQEDDDLSLRLSALKVHKSRLEHEKEQAARRSARLFQFGIRLYSSSDGGAPCNAFHIAKSASERSLSFIDLSLKLICHVAIFQHEQFHCVHGCMMGQTEGSGRLQLLCPFASGTH